MSVYKRGKYWSYKFRFQNQVIRESARTASKTVALTAERERRRNLELSFNRISKRAVLPIVKIAAKEWLATKTALCQLSILGYERRTATIVKEFGKRLLCDITVHDITAYQNKRRAAGLSARSVNYEVACLRGILKLHGLWGPIADRTKSLRENHDIGRAVSGPDEEKLLKSALASRSPVIYPLLVLSLDTGLRASEVRSLKHGDLCLRWEKGTIKEGYLVVPKSKTEAGKGRVVPFTKRVCTVTTMWLEIHGKQPASSHVFPRHKIGSTKKGSQNPMYNVNYAEPIGEWKLAWQNVCKEAGVKYRWHDLRHTFVSRLAENSGISEQTIREMAGHVSKEMMQRYSHIRIEAKKDAIASMERQNTPTAEDGIAVSSNNDAKPN